MTVFRDKMVYSRVNNVVPSPRLAFPTMTLHKQPSRSSEPRDNSLDVTEVYKSLCEIFSATVAAPRVRVRMARKIVDPIDVNATDSNGMTLLMLACNGNKQDMVDFLEKEYRKELDVNKIDHKGKSALHYASLQGRPSLVEKIKANMDNRNLGMKFDKETEEESDIFYRTGLKQLNSSGGDQKRIRHQLSASINHHSRPSSIEKFIPDERKRSKSQNLRPKSTSFPEIAISQDFTIRGRSIQSLWSAPRERRRKNSKYACSHLFNIWSMQYSDSFREGFPIFAPRSTPEIKIQGSRDSSRVSSPVENNLLQTRRGSFNQATNARTPSRAPSATLTRKSSFRKTSQLQQ